MTATQKTIKYIAIALAVFLIISIISGIVSAVIALGRFLTDDENYKLESYKTLDIKKEYKKIDLDINATNIIIKEGDSFKAETNNRYVYLKTNDEKLIIKEEVKHLFHKKIDSELIIYVPKDYNLEELKIDAGAGTVETSNIITDKLDFNLGAGKLIMQNVTVQDFVDIDGGAGSITIINSKFKNLDLDMGAGKLELEAAITGKSDINCGVGETNIKLLGKKQDYKLKISKGIGSVTVNGENYSSETSIGDGDNYIDIEGGVGAIKINFSEKEKY